MPANVSEKKLEDAIEGALLQGGPDAPAAETDRVAEPVLAWGEYVPGGYRKRASADYDRALCLIPEDTLSFI
jgi:hypothetical protein